jgi:NADH-quinone oxidoreductase subunit E
MAIDLSKIDTIIEKFSMERSGLIPALLGIQDVYHYLPPEALDRVAEKMNVPMIQVQQVAEFYKVFSLEPRGKHIITVCQGTACHVQGGDRLVDELARMLEIKPGATTKNMEFTLESVNCLGACSLGPVMTVDGKYYGHMAANKAEKLLAKVREADEQEEEVAA